MKLYEVRVSRMGDHLKFGRFPHHAVNLRILRAISSNVFFFPFSFDILILSIVIHFGVSVAG